MRKQLISLTANYKGNQKSIDGTERLGFEMTGQLRRSDFNMDWNGFNEDRIQLIDEQVAIRINIQLKTK